ncbi:unnamed protein product [Calypogeia fissa]
MASSGSQQFHMSRGFVPPRQGPAQSEDLGQIGSDKIRLRDEHYELMVSYLEILENFQAIIGGGRQNKVGGKYQSKIGESCLAPIESVNNQPVLGGTPPARPTPPKKGGKAFAALGKEKVSSKVKPVLKEKSYNILKPSFAVIYVEKNAQRLTFG